MNKLSTIFQWLISRVGVIYIVIFLFCLVFVDLKMLRDRTKIRHLNDSIPGFSDMIVFSRNHAGASVEWKPYQNYFELIVRYMPDDLLTKSLLGYVDYYSGHEKKAISLFKDSATLNGHDLFLPNYNLGIVYYKKQMWGQAAQYLFKAVSSPPKLNLFLVQNSMVYKQILLNPDFKSSFESEMKNDQGKAYILLLSCLDHLHQYDKVILLGNVALNSPDLPRKDAFYYYQGLACLEAGQPQKALLFFEKSLSIEKDNPDIYYYLAGIFQNAGQLQQAQNFLQASYSLHQKNDPRFPYDNQIDIAFF